MMPWDYNPVLAIPDPVRYLAPEWNSCTLPWGAMDDPPRALVTQTAIAMPTAPIADPVTTPASPSPATALPAQQTRAADAARTSAGDDSNAGPTSGNGEDVEKPQDASPTKAKVPNQVEDPAPATKVDNQPARTSTQNVGDAIASVIGAAGAGASPAQAGSAASAGSDGAGGDDPDADNTETSGGDPSDEPPAPGPGEVDPAPAATTINNEGGGDPVDADPPSTIDNQAKITLGSKVVTVRPAAGTSPGVVFGSQKLTPGALAIDAGGNTLSIGSSGEVHVDGTVAAVAGGETPAKVTLAPGNVVTAAPTSAKGNELVIGSQTLSAGGIGAILDGHTVPVDTEGVLAVNGAPAGSIALQEPSPTPIPVPITLGTKVLTAHDASGSGGALVLGGKTLQEGGDVAMLNGHVVSLDIHGKIQVDSEGVGDSTAVSTVPVNRFTEVIAPLTVGPETIFAEISTLFGGQKAAIIDGTTIIAASTRTTIGGAVVSFGEDGLVLQTAEATIPFSASTAFITAGLDALTASKTILANGQTAAVIGTHTLTAGGSAQTIEGDVFSLASNGLIELADATTAGFESSAQLITIDGRTLLAQYTRLSNGQARVIVGDETLTPGGPAETIHGELVRLGSDGLVVGAATTSAASPSISTTPSVVNAQVSAEETGAANAAVGRKRLGMHMTLALIGLLTALLRY